MIFKKSIIITIFFFSFLTFTASAQETEDYEYTSEFIWGVTKHTNSGLIGGLILKYSKALTPNKFQTFGFEIVNVKHPKEQRSYSTKTGNIFTFGKSNHLYSVRAQYGREFLLFKKAPQQGIQINANISGGPTLGVVAPYFVEVGPSNIPPYTQQYDPFNSEHSIENILGTGQFFQGIGKSKLNLGANIKSSLIFEFGTFKNNVTGFEAGFMVEGFPKEIVLVPLAENKAIYTSAFVTLFYGTRR
ncbi:MAG: hypothetical protein M3512_02265 [Bacteroidota bacterium]|nr:hypothetical protein [Bacteroidota bacterium]